MVQHLAPRLLVMYLGSVVETGPAETIWKKAAHTYTEALLAAAPVVDPRELRKRRKFVLQGNQPSPANLPKGCAISTRCPFAEDRCRAENPPTATPVRRAPQRLPFRPGGPDEGRSA